MKEVLMKMQWAQVLLIVFAMFFLSLREREHLTENNRLMKEAIKEVSKEVRTVKAELLDTNLKLIETKIELNRFHSDMNAHNLKMQRKTL